MLCVTKNGVPGVLCVYTHLRTRVRVCLLNLYREVDQPRDPFTAVKHSDKVLIRARTVLL